MKALAKKNHFLGPISSARVKSRGIKDIELFDIYIGQISNRE